MSQLMESLPKGPPASGDARRLPILAALRGAARNGWLGSAAAAPDLARAASPASDRVLAIDLLALSVKAALERLALPLARTARALAEARGWSTFGYARISDYARERLGRTGRWLHDQASLGRSLESFPQLAAAMAGEDGGRPLGKVSARLVGRVASADSVEAWIDLARGVSVRELKEIVKNALRSGADAPSVPIDECGSVRDGVSENGCLEGQADLDERYRLRMVVPIAVRAAFEETLSLHRAVSGQETSVADFIDALVAEAHAGLRPPDVESVASFRGSGAEAARERGLAKKTKLWAQLRERCEPGSEAALAAEALARFERIARRAGLGNAAELDRQLRELIELEDELERRLGRLLRELHDGGAWRRLCFAGVGHYAEQRLGLGRTAAEGRARLARALEHYPRLSRAYDEGRVGFESAQIVVRLLHASGADLALEEAWVERAEEATVKRLRDESRAIARRQGYEDRTGRAAPLDDAVWHSSLMQRPGEIRARVHELARRAVASRCSDVFLRLTLPEELARDFLAAVESARRGLAADARTFSARGGSVPSWAGLLALLEDYVETWDLPEAMPRRRSGEVYAREGWRCFAPGCTSRRNLEDHHLEYRSRGGDVKAMTNRVCLCAFHHRQGEHGDLATCRGEAPLGLLWRLGRNDVGVWFRNERRLNGGDRTAVGLGLET